ncbi:MAG: MerC domain-containing protein [Ferruginibacter sp.]
MASHQTHKRYSKWLDTIGIGASFACAIHCIALPVLFTTLPIFGVELLENRAVEITTIGISLVVGSWALVRGYVQHHKKTLPFLLFATGIILLAIARTVSTTSLEILIKLFAVSIIIAAHIINWKSCKKFQTCH